MEDSISFSIISSYSSPNFNDRKGKSISLIVLHYTGMKTAGEALERLCDPVAKVSAHYFIDEEGQVFQLIADGNRAWHAGVSYWGGERDVNGISLGIELANPGHEFGYHPFPKVQMQSLLVLLRGLVQKYNIKPHQVVGHSDVAPLRKQDPGELFDWHWLAQHGIGLWPDREYSENNLPLLSQEEAAEALAAVGYDVDVDWSMLLTAFQRHFCSDAVDGTLNKSTRVMLKLLVEKLKHL